MKTKDFSHHSTASKDVARRRQPIQAKLAVSRPGDAHEQQADAMADKVMRGNDTGNGDAFFKPAPPSIQRTCRQCEEENVQKKESAGETTHASIQTENYIGSLNGKGRPLNGHERGFFEPKFGYDLSNVQLHTDNEANRSAEQLNALAYTHGNNIVFRQGEYNTNSDSGKRLMAHELTHVIQQQHNTALKPVQRYTPPGGSPNPFAPQPVSSEAYAPKTEIISNAPDPRWNGKFDWDARFQVVYDGNTKRATIVSRLYCDVEDNVKQGWKNAIENRWGGGKFQLEVWETCNPRVIPIDVNIQWMIQPAMAHYSIHPVLPGELPPPGKTMGVGGTADMTTWGTVNYTDVPHEYGHMLGNPEEYFTTNGVDYTYGGKKSGYRDYKAGIMNNPSEAPEARHYNMVRDAFIKMLATPPGLTRIVAAGSTNPALKAC